MCRGLRANFERPPWRARVRRPPGLGEIAGNVDLGPGKQRLPACCLDIVTTSLPEP